MARRPILLAVLTGTALVLGLEVGVAPPAQADPAPIVAATISAGTVHPGESVTMAVTYTNSEAVPVTFAYLSASPTFQTWAYSGVKYRVSGCTGQMWGCYMSNPDPPLGAYMYPAYPTGAPLGPGQSRTETITIQVDPTSPCGGRYIDFFFYSYRESAAGNVGGPTVSGPGVLVDC